MKPTIGILAFILLISSPLRSLAFNSEEHKYMVDQALESLAFSPSLNFPKSVRFTRYPNYLKVFEKAKEFAMGKPRSLSTAYTKERLRRFCQDDFNANIWIPPAAIANALFLPVESDPEHFTRAASFTLGELAALYGDYRKSIGNTDNPFELALTSAAIKAISFKRANHPKKAPRKQPYHTYLRYIASGVVPPIGCAANRSGNTARDNEFEEAGWWGDDMLRMANINDWHFSKGAIGWYTGMHRLALRFAALAKKNPRYWILAFHYEANALHSYTDLFAFGHVVTNRGQSTFEVLRKNGELRKGPYLWMESVLRLGGCTRKSNGILQLNSKLPTGQQLPSDRNDFIRTDARLTNIPIAVEKTLHDEFNGKGARVRNLLGDVFQASGDGKYGSLSGSDQEVIANGIRASVQSLFDAFQNNATDEDLVQAGSGYFSALNHLPIYIVEDPDGYFTGRFASYAGFIANLDGGRSGRTLPPNWRDCEIKFMSGQSFRKPRRNQPACTIWE